MMKHVSEDDFALSGTGTGAGTGAGAGHASVETGVGKLDFVLSDAARGNIRAATKASHELASSLQLEARVNRAWGTDQCKSQFKCSPDGLFQQAIQLAYYKMHGKTVATYESGSTQSFLGGRTETIRSATLESKAFVRAFASGGADVHALCRTAIDRHSQVAVEAATGKGFDRHLFVLNALAAESGLPKPDLLAGHGWSFISKNVLSTSTVSNPFVAQIGFGPVVQNGYGIMYHHAADHTRFAVTTYEGSSTGLADALEESLADIADIVRSGPAAA